MRETNRHSPMWRVVLLLVGCCVLAILLVPLGCKDGNFNPWPDPNIAPETTLSVDSGQPDPGSRIRLNWFGWDPDGEVVSFDIRSAPDDSMGEWNSVVNTDSVLILSPELEHSWAFWVRAVDNEGAVDATPESVLFLFRDH